MMNNQKWSLGIVGIAIASGIVISSSVSAQSGDHDIGGTRIQNSNTVNPGGGSTSGGGDSSPARRATPTSANELSNSIQQVRDRISAIEAAQQAAEGEPVRIVRSKDEECLTPEQLEELEQELESLVNDGQQLIDEQNQTQPNDGSW
jgi:hypothetical protein